MLYISLKIHTIWNLWPLSHDRSRLRKNAWTGWKSVLGYIGTTTTLAHRHGRERI